MKFLDWTLSLHFLMRIIIAIEKYKMNKIKKGKDDTGIRIIAAGKNFW